MLEDYNRKLRGIKVDSSLTAARVVHVLTRFVECHSLPVQLCTNDPSPEVSA